MMAHRISKPHMLAGFVDFDSGEDDALVELLHGFRSQIKGCLKRMNRAAGRCRDDDDIGDVVIEERDLIEAILGCAFVLCQERITAVASRMLRVAKSLDIPWCKDRDHITRLGVKPLPGFTLTVIEAIDTGANYFKHREEWQTHLQDLPNGERERQWKIETVVRGGVPRPAASAKTINAVQSFGLRFGNSENLATLAKSLGIDVSDFSNLPDLAAHVRTWQAALADIVRISHPR